jgi:hypothetical protein
MPDRTDGMLDVGLGPLGEMGLTGELERCEHRLAAVTAERDALLYVLDAVTAERDELLEALRGMVAWFEDVLAADYPPDVDEFESAETLLHEACAAITKIEEGE